MQNEKGLPSRRTFIIGPDGKILHVHDKVNTKAHGAEIAEKLAELGTAKKKAS